MSNEASSKQSGTYHHGNLKSALTDAYIELLADHSPECISLRKLATHLSVAPAAVYNHFADKDALTTAVRTRCLHHFGDFLEQNHNSDATPEQNLLALGKAYFRYSLDYPAYFKIIFQHTTPQNYVTDELLAAGMHAEEHLRKSVIDLLLHHGIPVTQYNEGLGAFACWALAHGVTSLAAIHVNRAACISERWPPEFMLNDTTSVDQAFEALINVLIQGVLATAKT